MLDWLEIEKRGNQGDLHFWLIKIKDLLIWQLIILMARRSVGGCCASIMWKDTIRLNNFWKSEMDKMLRIIGLRDLMGEAGANLEKRLNNKKLNNSSTDLRNKGKLSFWNDKLDYNDFKDLFSFINPKCSALLFWQAGNLPTRHSGLQLHQFISGSALAVTWQHSRLVQGTHFTQNTTHKFHWLCWNCPCSLHNISDTVNKMVVLSTVLKLHLEPSSALQRFFITWWVCP